MEEKGAYNEGSPQKYSNEAPPYDGNRDMTPAMINETKGMGIGEGADMYGDVATAEDYGYVTRGYEENQLDRLGRPEADSIQVEIASHSIHSPRGYHWYWAIFGDREGFHGSWTVVSVVGLYFYWNRNLRNGIFRYFLITVAVNADPCSIDAIVRRNGDMVTTSWSDTTVLRSLR